MRRAPCSARSPSALTGLAFLGARHARRRTRRHLARRERRSASSLVLGAYALRAAGDALGTPGPRRTLTLQPAWPSWLSPIGWGQQTLAFTDEPLVAGRGARRARGGRDRASRCVVHSRRELGASLLPERAGRATARADAAARRSALAWRLQWPTLHRLDGRLGAARPRARLAGHRDRRERDSSTTRRSPRILQSLGHTGQADIAPRADPGAHGAGRRRWPRPPACRRCCGCARRRPTGRAETRARRRRVSRAGWLLVVHRWSARCRCSSCCSRPGSPRPLGFAALGESDERVALARAGARAGAGRARRSSASAAAAGRAAAPRWRSRSAGAVRRRRRDRAASAGCSICPSGVREDQPDRQRAGAADRRLGADDPARRDRRGARRARRAGASVDET